MVVTTFSQQRRKFQHLNDVWGSRSNMYSRVHYTKENDLHHVIQKRPYVFLDLGERPT